jgi:hypothetical protein
MRAMRQFSRLDNSLSSESRVIRSEPFNEFCKWRLSPQHSSWRLYREIDEAMVNLNPAPA